MFGSKTRSEERGEIERANTDSLLRHVLPINPLTVFELRNENLELFQTVVAHMFDRYNIDGFSKRPGDNSWRPLNPPDHPLIFKGFERNGDNIKLNLTNGTHLSGYDSSKFSMCLTTPQNLLFYLTNNINMLHL